MLILVLKFISDSEKYLGAVHCNKTKSRLNSVYESSHEPNSSPSLISKKSTKRTNRVKYSSHRYKKIAQKNTFSIPQVFDSSQGIVKSNSDQSLVSNPSSSTLCTFFDVESLSAEEDEFLLTDSILPTESNSVDIEEGGSSCSAFSENHNKSSEDTDLNLMFLNGQLSSPEIPLFKPCIRCEIAYQL